MAVGALFHLAHTTADAAGADGWYREVLGAREFLALHTLESEKRDAALLAAADTVLEPVSPAFGADGWETRPFGRYYQRFGPHWHSIACYTDDPVELWQRCRSAGVRLFGMGGAVTEPPGATDTLFTHPRDTLGQLQFTPLAGSRYERLDPRLRPDWDSGWWRDEHPLGLVGLAHVAVLCRELGDGLRVYVDVLGGTPLGTGECRLTGTEFADVTLGTTVVRLSVPAAGVAATADLATADLATADLATADLATADLAAAGPGPHAVAFRVAELDRAERHLESSGIRVLARDDTTLLTDPASTLGVPFRWTAAP